MARKETNIKKIEMSYNLTRQRKFFRKARAVVVKNNKLFLIRVDYNDGRVHYLLPGGGVENGETIKQAIVRETLEEYNAVVTPIKYLDKQYYNIELEYNGESFVSHRVEYYYVCRFESFVDDMPMGVEDEFKSFDRKYTKVELSLKDVLKLKHKDINSMNERTYRRLVGYMKENNMWGVYD